MYSLDSDIYAALEGPRFIACIITVRSPLVLARNYGN